MDGAIKTTTTERLIALDITDAAEKLWAELHEEALNNAFGLLGDGDYGAPRVARAWELYVDRGAHNYPWWRDEDGQELNALGDAAFALFETAFEDGAGIYGMQHAV